MVGCISSSYIYINKIANLSLPLFLLIEQWFIYQIKDESDLTLTANY